MADVSLFGGRQGRHGHNKAAINNTLETNPVPTIWISNDVHYLDPAYLRRFDYAVELRAPPRSVRRNIIQRYFADLPLPESCFANLAEHDDLTPAQVERVAKVARGSGIVAPDELGKAVERMIDSTMTMMRQRKSPRKSGRSIDFGIEFLSIETPIDLLIQGIRESESCRLCFYGPPGTGKTSLARHIAEALDRPLIVKRPSDLLGCFVGETEQNIASMFNEARDEGAILLLDEADSFLQDRQAARQSWEVTQVNELLTQMEGFDGIFLCATNLMDRFDPASLRRFDFKIRFGYLNPEQRRELFRRHLEELGYPCTSAKSEELGKMVEHLANLTPGDYAVANRQCRIIRTKSSPSFFLATLKGECEGKPGWSRKAGFV